MEELVVDASALVDALTNESAAAQAMAERIEHSQLFAPDHLFVESTQAIKSLSPERDHTEGVEDAAPPLNQVEMQRKCLMEFTEKIRVRNPTGHRQP